MIVDAHTHIIYAFQTTTTIDNLSLNANEREIISMTMLVIASNGGVCWSLLGCYTSLELIFWKQKHSLGVLL